jgi:REP element-mobilizing transposase RayT
MPYRKFQFVAEQYYHLYNRGNNFQTIFFEQENYLYFLSLIRKYLTPEDVEVIAYCLMPNHYHLLVYLHSDDLSKCMQPLLLAYTKAINKRFNRVGALFQGRFKGKWIDRNAYLLHLSRYIHHNPVTAGLVSKPEDWEFSSYRDYIGIRAGTLPDPDIILSQFSSREEYQELSIIYCWIDE